MKKVCLFAFLCLAFTVSVFAEINVISPIEGNWANKQMLVIDVSDGADYFYSLNGSDPAVAGFAYDGPVLIDLTGDVTVKISKGLYESEKKQISFSVNQEYPKADLERAFVYSFIDTGILNYSSGAEIQIPETMRYSFEEVAKSYIKGRVLKYSDICSISRFIPCTVTNGEVYWRFVIRTNPKTSGAYSRRDLPIKIIDWDEISFTDDDLIYRIDDEYWSLPKDNVKIDRSKPHIIYWQSIAFETGNPIEFIELPPKPELQKSVNKDGSVSFYLSGSELYSMNFVSSDVSYQELFTELCVDTFYGDYLSEKRKVAVYSDSVFQGTLDIEYEVDKRVAPLPEIAASVKGFYVHGDLDLYVATSNKAKLYIAVSDPVIMTGKEDFTNPSSPVFVEVPADNFKEYGSSHTIHLDAVTETSTFYKIRAYSKLGATESDILEYNVVVDNFDYYFNALADNVLADGTPEHPFTSFEQGFDLVKSKNLRTVNFFVTGSLSLPKGRTELLFNCRINGIDNASLVFPEGASLVIKTATLQISDCLIVADNSEVARNVSSSLIKLENSVLEINNCEVSSLGLKNNTVIEASNSAVSLNESIFSSTATLYASLLSSSKSKVNISSCKFGIAADSAVAFSVRGGEFKMNNSSVKVTGTIGRICEFFGATANVLNNEFKGDLKKHGVDIMAIYSDKKTTLRKTSNEVMGF